MKIAQIAPLYETVPPKAYGGTERVIAGLCDGLTNRGHEVTLFAAGESVTLADLDAVVPSPLRMRMTREEMVDIAPHLHLRMLAEVFDRAGEFDVIHSHIDIWTLPFAYSTEVPTLLTMHGRLDLEHVRRALELYPGVPLVSISDDQRRGLHGIDVTWAGTVYNGLDFTAYADDHYTGSPHLAFVGRIAHEKGPTAAVEIAARTNRQLHAAAKVDPTDIEYFERDVEPVFAANDVVFVGEIDEERKPTFFGSAAATLFPSDWPEPFGLVMIESMAAGTPVIALRRGSVPEVVVDGVTGFICDDIDDMAAAVRRIGDLDRDACRRHAANFDVNRMCAGYEAIYEKLTTTSQHALYPTG